MGTPDASARSFEFVVTVDDDGHCREPLTEDLLAEAVTLGLAKLDALGRLDGVGCPAGPVGVELRSWTWPAAADDHDGAGRDLLATPA